MKKIVFWALLVMILAFGMTVVGCDDDPTKEKNDDDAFAGTWVSEHDDHKIIAADGSWNWYDDQNNVVASGTYTTSGNNVTLSMPSENNINATISGNTISIPITVNGTPVTAIFTKQGTQSNTDAFAGTWFSEDDDHKIIAADGSWNWYDDQNNVVASGTYTTSGNNVTLSMPSVNNINATISGNTISIPITVNGTPVTAIFTKQGT